MEPEGVPLEEGTSDPDADTKFLSKWARYRPVFVICKGEEEEEEEEEEERGEERTDMLPATVMSRHVHVLSAPCCR